VILGMVTTFALMILYTTGTIVYSDDFPNQKLPTSIAGCDANSTKAFLNFGQNHDQFNSLDNTVQSDWKNNNDSALIRVLSVSYMWYSGMGCILMVISGILFSFAFNFYENEAPVRVKSTCISPPLLRFWNKVLTKERMERWILFEDKNIYYQNNDLDIDTDVKLKL
jgi:hypothetical protein